MHFINCKNNIQSFCFFKDKLLYTTTEKEIIFDNKVLFKSDELLQEIYCNNEVAYTNTINGDGIEIDILKKKINIFKNEFIKYIDATLKITTQNKKSKILTIKNRITTYKPIRISKFIIQKSKNRILYYEGSIFETSNHKIIQSSLTNDKNYFVFKLSLLGLIRDGLIEKPYQISDFCDIYNDILISTMNNGDILLFNTVKGKPIKLFEDAKMLGGIFQKEVNNSVFIGLKFKTYIEFDVIKQEIIKQVDLEEYFKQIFNRSILVPINTTIYKNGLIYFIADTDIIGVFDPITVKIIDFYEFKFLKKLTMLKGGKENLQINGNTIYCLDTMNNLHTLEFKNYNLSKKTQGNNVQKQ